MLDGSTIDCEKHFFAISMSAFISGGAQASSVSLAFESGIVKKTIQTPLLNTPAILQQATYRIFQPHNETQYLRFHCF